MPVRTPRTPRAKSATETPRVSVQLFRRVDKRKPQYLRSCTVDAELLPKVEEFLNHLKAEDHELTAARIRSSSASETTAEVPLIPGKSSTPGSRPASRAA